MPSVPVATRLIGTVTTFAFSVWHGSSPYHLGATLACHYPCGNAHDHAICYRPICSYEVFVGRVLMLGAFRAEPVRYTGRSDQQQCRPLRAPHVDDSDPDLIRRVQARELTALDAYLVACRRPLLAFIDRELGAALRRKIEVDDIFQESSVEAVRSLSEADLSQRDPFGWLCQIAERRIIDAHRRFFGAQKRDAGREVPLGSPGGDTQHAAIIDLLVASHDHATQALAAKDTKSACSKPWRRCPKNSAKRCGCAISRGCRPRRSPTRLGKTDGSVRVMLTRALSRLQQILGPDDAPR